MSDEQAAGTAVSSVSNGDQSVSRGGFTPPENRRETIAKYEKAAEVTAEPKPEEPKPVETPATATEPAKTEPKTTAVDGAKYEALLKSGDFEGALKLAGIDTDGMKIPASRWAEFRKHEKETKERLRTAEASVLRKDAEVRALAADVAKKFEPFDLARKAWDSGDIESAIKHAFGADLESFSEMAVKHKLGQDPEVVALKRWKSEQEQAAKDRADAEAKALAEQTTAAQRREYCTALASELKTAGATFAAAVDAFPDLAERVMRIQLDAYNKSGDELSAEDAAGQLIQNLRPFLEKWSKILGPMGAEATPKPPSSVETAIESQDTDRTGKSSANERRFVAKKKAQPAPPVPDSDLSEDEKLSRWKKRLVVAAREDGYLPG